MKNAENKLGLITDLYELVMSNIYHKENLNKTVFFDVFFRNIPDDGGFAIFAGLEQLIENINNFKFSKGDISYLKTLNSFDNKFLNYLENFSFSSDIWCVKEGTPIFPNEPILIFKGKLIEAQLLETLILSTINHQSLIATKANRIVRSAGNKNVLEFGARRALGIDSALFGARASYIGGTKATSLTLAGKKFGIPVIGTMAHSFVQLFDSELEAFKAFAKVYPDKCILLIDTYSALKSGIFNAIKVFKEDLLPKGFRPLGIRIDSGDIAYLSKKIRIILDDEGFSDCKIFASNSLDEHIIKDLINQDAKIDSFCVGERLITSSSSPIFGGVYKLSAIKEEENIIPKIKISENVSKITTPDFKNSYRLFDKENNKALADIITLHDEKIDCTKPYKIFDPENTWKQKEIKNFTVKPLLKKIFKDGKCVYKNPTIDEIRSYCKNQVSTLWEEVKRLKNPHKYYVDLSLPLWRMKNELINKYSK